MGGMISFCLHSRRDGSRGAPDSRQMEDEIDVIRTLETHEGFMLELSYRLDKIEDSMMSAMPMK